MLKSRNAGQAAMRKLEKALAKKEQLRSTPPQETLITA
jgi:hypothetical protein